MKYTLSEINNLSFGVSHFEIPDDTLSIINYLCSNVGSDGLQSNIFQKIAKSENDSSFSGGFKPNRKRKGNKSMEVSSEEWESIRTFQATKIEQKTGIDGEIDQIRLLLNKLTDKTFLDIREKLIEKINNICTNSLTEENGIKIANIIYEISSTNKFYSKIYADLYAELVSIYSWLMPIFEENYSKLMEQYKNIHYVDPDSDYDGFCNMNKVNEKRKAITTFFVNLAMNKFISYDGILDKLTDLLRIVYDMISLNDKKNEVDELTENIAILFNKEMIDEIDDDDKYNIHGKTIIEIVNGFAKSKAKDYPSLSNKAIFKYMDLVEM